MLRELSTLEYTVLGFAWLRGPCSIYAIMKELGSSESTYHKNRAGTAYSVANRLLKSGLLEAHEDGSVQITPLGLRQLQSWLAPPIPMGDIAHSADLLRLRFFFLEAISPEQRDLFIEESLRSLQDLLARCERLLQENADLGDGYGVLATANMVLETRARIHWIELVREVWRTEPVSAEAWLVAVRARL